MKTITIGRHTGSISQGFNDLMSIDNLMIQQYNQRFLPRLDNLMIQ